APYLLAAGTGREEVERAAVGGPARARVPTARVGELLWTGPGCQRHQPQAATGLVRGQVGFPQHEDQQAPIGRHLRIAQALESHQVFDREARAALGRLCAAKLWQSERAGTQAE